MVNLEKLINDLEQTVVRISSLHNPNFYRCLNDSDRKHLQELIENNKSIIVFDYIKEQLSELVKIKNPAKKFTSLEIDSEIRKHLNNITEFNYGVWVFYPWSNRLVHILDEEEFIEVRTSRNQYKITKAERDILATKKIGIIGLSVGQSVAVTLAMERVCGEIRLADFDLLELTNLNRIRTGIHNLGLAKVYSVAREIAEIDPFIKIICFPEGLKEENMTNFFTSGGKLDLMIEESDGFDIKILSRIKARELKIPVLMEASDRCMVDVERFDLEPNRDILHGLVNHLEVSKLKSLKTTEEKIPYMLDILGLETSSLRLKSSMLEIEQSINTWPQLASAVTMGGGITTDVARRILLNQFNGSGRFHIDIEELIGDEVKEEKFNSNYHFPAFNLDEFKSTYKPEKTNEKSIFIEINLLSSWLHKAIMAPSAGNNQPWKWYYTGGVLHLIHDKEKSYSWSDNKDIIAHLALGAALQNLYLACKNDGYKINVSYFPNNLNQLHIASIQFEKGNEVQLSLAEQKLFNAIENRCTNRKKGNSEKPNQESIRAILESVSQDYTIRIIDNENSIEELADIISSIEKQRFLNPEGHYEFFNKEIRWNDKEVLTTRDGLDIETLELNNLNKTGMKVAANKSVIKNLIAWNGGDGLKKMTREVVETSPLIGLLQVKSDKFTNYIDAGAMLQNAWLSATANSISFHPVSSPIFFFEKIKSTNDLSSELINYIEEEEKRFNQIIMNDVNYKNIFLFRLSISEQPTAISLRKNLSDCLIIED